MSYTIIFEPTYVTHQIIGTIKHQHVETISLSPKTEPVG